MYMSKILQLFASIIFFLRGQHDFNKDPYYFFDSKTAYTFVHGNDLKIPENCQIQQVFTLFRHGTRTASTTDNKDMLQLFLLKDVIKEKAKLKRIDINAILNWKNKANRYGNKDLNKQGMIDMNKLASRVKSAFGDIFKDQFDPNIHKVLTSQEVRARQSGFHFLKNAFGSMIHITSLDDLPMFDDDDVTLNVDKFRPKKVSKKKEKIENLPKSEMTSFREGPEMQATLKRIAYRIGLKSSLTFAQGKAMYQSCRYDKARYVDTTPAWCRVFTKQDIQVFEYLNDLSSFYKFGWGNEFNVQLGCPLLTRLNLSFKLAAQNTGARGVFYFGHSSNQLVAITMLGLARDRIPLKADNMEQMANRNWKTSHLSPFAANTIAAFYKCDDGDDRVSFFVNEKIMTIDLDDNSTCSVCLWKKVEEKFDRITADKKKCGFGYTITAP